MAQDNKQFECDLFEETVLTNIFGAPKVPTAVDIFLRMRKIDIQDKINGFEAFIKEFMDDRGYVDGGLLREAAALKYPRYAELIPNGHFRLVDEWRQIYGFIKQLIGA